MAAIYKLPEQLTKYILVNTETGEWYDQRFYENVTSVKTSFSQNCRYLLPSRPRRCSVRYDEQSLWKIQKVTFAFTEVEDVR